MKKFLKDQSGATAVEYGIIAATMGLGLIAVMPNLATSIFDKFGSIAGHLASGK